jgi:hypothetical protein
MSHRHRFGGYRAEPRGSRPARIYAVMTFGETGVMPGHFLPNPRQAFTGA